MNQSKSLSVLLFPIFTSTSQAGNFSEEAGIMYIQSHMANEMLYLCEKLSPDFAKVNEMLIANWKANNKNTLKVGKKFSDHDAKTQGYKFEEMLAKQKKQILDKTNKMEGQKLADQCALALSVFMRETFK